MTTEIETYVADERKRGVVDGDIRKELIVKGWAPEKINEALEPTASVRTSTTEVVNGRKYSNLGILFAFLSLITLPIVFGPLGVFFGVKGYLRNDEKRGMFAIIISVLFAVASTLAAMYFLRAK